MVAARSQRVRSPITGAGSHAYGQARHVKILDGNARTFPAPVRPSTGDLALLTAGLGEP
jgi:hypothetical protein